MVGVYHYTSSEGVKGIEETGLIKKSIKRGARPDDDAAYGEGVYFTSLGPHYETDKLVLNNYDGNISNIQKLIKSKGKFVECCFEFESDEIKGIENVGDVRDRDVWLYRGKDLVIKDYNYTVKYRKL